MPTSKEEIEDSIAALEAQRSVLGDAVVDPAIVAMKKQLEELSDKEVPEFQRKQLTILFLDIVESTSLFSHLDPEETLSIVDAALQQLAKSVETNGGRVTRFMGDGFLATFGLPIARENDPEMAVRAGLEIVQTGKLLASSISKSHGISGFKVRVGINTGLVVTGGLTEAEDTLTGGAVNLAARMESAAPANGILISEYTYQLVRSIFDINPMGQLAVKGFIEPIQVYEVISLKPSILRSIYRGVEGIVSPVIGRESEIAGILQSFEDCTTQSKTKLMAITGPTGVGKSRLLMEIESTLMNQNNQSQILRGKANLETKRVSYGLLKNILSNYFSIFDEGDRELALRKIEKELLGVLGEAGDQNSIDVLMSMLGYEDRKSEIPDTLIDNPKELREITSGILLKFFAKICETTPHVLLLEDMQWVDRSSLEIIHAITQSLENRPMLVIFAFRPVFWSTFPDWNDDYFVQTLELTNLDFESSKEVISHLLVEMEYVPDYLNNILFESSDGNPYYLVEIINMFKDQGILIETEGSWQLQEHQLNEYKVPQTLTGVIQARIDNLPSTERLLLQQASIIGTSFVSEILVYINQEEDLIGSVELTNSLSSLLAKGLVHKAVVPKFSGMSEYVLKSQIYREVVYQSVLKKIRSNHHFYIAKWYVENIPSTNELFNSTVAYHFEKANMTEEALKYYTKAAWGAFSKHAVEEADTLFLKALELNDDNIELEFDLLMGREKVIDLKGRRDIQEELHQRLDQLAHELNSTAKFHEVQIRKAWMYYWLGNYSKMYEISKSVESYAVEQSDQELLCQSLIASGWACIQSDKALSALTYSQQSLELAQIIEKPVMLATSVNLLGMNNLALRNLTTARENIREFLRISRQIKNSEREQTALNNLGVISMRLGQAVLAERYFREAYDLAKDRGNRIALSTSNTNLCWVLALQQRWEEVVELGSRTIKEKQVFKHRDAEAEANMWVAHAYFGREDMVLAEQHYNKALELRQELGQVALSMGAIAGLLRVDVKTNHLSESLTKADTIYRFIKNGGDLDQTWEPLRIHYSVIMAFKANDDPRWEELRDEAASIVEDYLAKIEDKHLRHEFIHNVPWRRKLVEYF